MGPLLDLPLWAEKILKLNVFLCNLKMHTLWSIDSQEISKIGATRCQILRLKCTKFDFPVAPPQTPLEELTALPQIL